MQFHLFRYLDEQTFRFNNRDMGDDMRFRLSLRTVCGRRLTYKDLTGKSTNRCRKILRYTITIFVAAFAFCGSAYGQSERCPVLAKLPADLKDSASPEDRIWFELRQCNGEIVVVNAYERQKTKPSLTFNTGSIYPSFLAHTFNVLILESLGGSANHVTVITFHKGKPSVVLNRSAVGVQIKRAENEIIVTITPKTYPGPDGKFPTVPDSVYRFQLEY